MPLSEHLCVIQCNKTFSHVYLLLRKCITLFSSTHWTFHFESRKRARSSVISFLQKIKNFARPKLKRSKLKCLMPKLPKYIIHTKINMKILQKIHVFFFFFLFVYHVNICMSKCIYFQIYLFILLFSLARW